MGMRLIDADTLTRALTTIDRLARSDKQAALLGRVYYIVSKQPTVDAEPVRHGRWVKMTGMLPPEYHGHYECSECQWHMKGIRNSWTGEEDMSYCPNCGAKMEGGLADGKVA